MIDETKTERRCDQMIVHKCKAWHKNRKCMIQADDFYFSADEFEPFVDTVQRAMEEFDLLWWSGLYDHTGAGIYQGDIILNFDTYTHLVECVHGAYGYHSPDNGFVAFASNRNLEWSQSRSAHIRVVGNNHENPELLK